MARLWEKGQKLDDLILDFTVGQDFILDQRLVSFDILASIAHVEMLSAQGYIPNEEANQLVETLEAIGSEFVAGLWNIQKQDEDCHTAIEAQLMERIGSIGGKVHLGRSRNDQVLTALRLYLKREVESFEESLTCILSSCKDIEEQFGEVKIPGYTHMQQAMPSSVSLWISGFRSLLQDNRILLTTAKTIIDQCPLGSAAGYGTPGLLLNRKMTTMSLGFSKVQEPVTSCQLSRGKGESMLAFALTQILSDLGRLSADICLFSSQEFGIVKLADEISTGSSIMPQKRNPDVFELIRGHSSQALADFLSIAALTNGLPSGYHRDLQLMKEPLFRIIDRAHFVLEIASYSLTKISFDQARAAAINTPGIHAAEEAFELVKREGISFREAYQRVSKSHG